MYFALCVVPEPIYKIYLKRKGWNKTKKNMSRTKLIPEVFLDIFLYMRDSRERRESGLPIRGSLIQRKKNQEKPLRPVCL